MIIVKRRGEIVRLGLFLLLFGAMAYFVMTRAGSFMASSTQQAGTETPAAARSALPELPGPGPAVTTEAPGARDYFAEARMARDEDRSQHKQELTELIDNPNIDAGVRKSAAEELRAALNFASLEARAEALVRGRGVDDVLVTLTAANAVVDVKAKDTSKQHAVQLADAVAKLTGLKLSAITVRFAE